MNPSFGPISLKGLEPTMSRYYKEFLDGIEEKAGQNGGVVEMNQWFHNLSFDVFSASRVF
jgi:cytochrome P450